MQKNSLDNEDSSTNKENHSKKNRFTSLFGSSVKILIPTVILQQFLASLLSKKFLIGFLLYILTTFGTAKYILPKNQERIIKNQRETLTKLEDQNRELKKNYTDIKSKLDQQISQSTKLERSNKTLQDQFSAANKTITELKKTSKNSKGKLKNLVQQLKKEIQVLKANYQSERLTLQNQYKALKEIKENYQQASRQASQRLFLNEILLNKKKRELDHLKDKVRTLKNIIYNEKKDSSNFPSEIKEKNSRIKNLESQILLYQKRILTYQDELNTKKDSFYEQLSDLKFQNTESKVLIEELENQLTDKKAELAECFENFEKIYDAIKSLENRMESNEIMNMLKNILSILQKLPLPRLGR